MTTKRIISLLLSVVLLLGMLPVSIAAEETEPPQGTEATETTEITEVTETTEAAETEPAVDVEVLNEYLQDRMAFPFPEGIALYGGTGTGVVQMGPPAVEWIDRIANLPDFAVDFYDWLVENSDGDGAADALIDPTTGTNIEGGYYAEIYTEHDKTIVIICDPYGTQEEFNAALEEALNPEVEEWVASYGPYLPAIFGAFQRDNPQVFWLSGTCGWTMLIDNAELAWVGGNQFHLTCDFSMQFMLQTSEYDVRAEEYRSASNVRTAIATRNNAVAQITGGASGTRYEKVCYLNRWLTEHNCYNTSADLYTIGADCRSCMGALLGSTGTAGPVCEGYASAFKVLCDELGIPCVLVDGLCGDEAHMWCYVQMEDANWYAVDATWNDPAVDGISAAKSGYENEDYLLIGSNTSVDGTLFAASHTVTNTPMHDGTAFTNGPALAANKYNPTIPHTHAYTAAVTAPTCVDKGYTTHSCACGDSYADSYTAATGVHTYTSEIDVDCDVCGAVRETDGGELVIPFYEFEWEVLRLTNIQRVSNGLAPLTGFAKLQNAAHVRAGELITLFSHDRPDGTSCFTALDEADVNYGYAGENIASGYRTPAAVVDGWMNSSGHRQNILNSSFAHLGVGENTFQWVQMFVSGSGYTSITVYAPQASVEPGTGIDEMGLAAVLQSKSNGPCYLPVAASYCSGYDPNKAGVQTVTISVLGVTGTFTITVDHVHSYDDNLDGTCNICGVDRAEVENRIPVHMFRMYNPNTGEHFYTGSEVEKNNLIREGWNYEGVGFTFPANTGLPVHRLFHEPTGEHLYTMDEAEKELLMSLGWNYEGVAFNSAYDTEAVQHRLHNPNATVGAYHFTFSEEEKQNLINAGWEYQGIGWYSCFK